MNLLKIGDRFINLDRVTDFMATDEDVLVHFEPHAIDVSQNMHAVRWRFTGGEAAMLRRWLERHADNVAELEDGLTGDLLGDPQPYNSPR